MACHLLSYYLLLIYYNIIKFIIIKCYFNQGSALAVLRFSVEPGNRPVPRDIRDFGEPRRTVNRLGEPRCGTGWNREPAGEPRYKSSRYIEERRTRS